jgi:hypothetical protein
MEISLISTTGVVLSITSKVMRKIIVNRITAVVNPYFSKEQAGFR